MKTAEKQVTETGLLLNGATEWWTYVGLCDGYYKEVDPYKKVQSIAIPWTKIGQECQECYLFGYFLGKEIKQSEQKEKKEKALEKMFKIPERYSVSDGKSLSKSLGLGDAVE